MSPTEMFDDAADRVQAANSFDDAADRVQAAIPFDDARRVVRRALAVGWLAKGLLFVIIGLLGVELARRGHTGRDADQTGALTALVEITAGRLLVFAISLALLGFAAWQIWEAIARDENGPLAIAERAGSFGLGLVYGLLAHTGLRIAWEGGPTPGAGSDSGPTSPTGLTRRILELPAGVVIVLGIGVATALVGCYQLWKGVRGDYLDDIETDDLSPAAKTALQVLATTGAAARALLLGIAGWLFADAAIEENAGRAAGMDDALRQLSTAPLGTLLLAVTGIGLVAAGTFDAVTFRRRRISDDDED